MADGDPLLPWVELGRNFIEPLAVAVEGPAQAAGLLAELGYLTPSDITALEELGGGIGMVAGGIEALMAAIDAEDEEAALAALAELLVGLGRVFAGANTVGTRLQAEFAGSGLLTDTDILTELPRRLTDHLIVRLLEDHHPTVFAALLLVGVVDIEDIDETPTAFHAPYRRRTVRWEEIPDLLSDPIGALKANLREQDEFLFERLAFFLYELAVARALPATYDGPDPDVLQTINDGTDLTTREDYDEITILRFPLVRDPALSLGLDLYPRIDPATGARKGLGAALRLGGQLEIPLGESWQLVLTVGATLTDSLGLVLEPDATPRFVNKLLTASPEDILDSVQFGVKVGIEPAETRPPGNLVTLGLPLGARFELGSGSIALGIEKLDHFRLFVETDLTGGVFAFGTDDADGFVSNVVPIDAIAPSSASGWASRRHRPVLHRQLGHRDPPAAAPDPRADRHRAPHARRGVQGGHAAPDRRDRPVGQARPDRRRRRGHRRPRHLRRRAPIAPATSARSTSRFGFKPPNGVGLAIDAGVVKGGGYLFIDSDRGRVRRRARARRSPASSRSRRSA